MNKKYIQVTIISIVGILLICGCTQTSKNTKDSQKGSELEAVDTLHILQVGEKAVDAELFDMQGNKHRLFEAFADNRYVLFDFWNLHCGACRKAESELLEVYDRMKGRLEIVAINLDSISEWQAHEWSKKIVWKNFGRTGMTARSSSKEVSRATITILMPYLSTYYCRPMAVFFGRWLVMAQVVSLELPRL